MYTKVDLDEERRLDLIRGCAKAIVMSIDEMKNTFENDDEMREEITDYINKICNAMGRLGTGNVDDATRQLNELMKEVMQRAMQVDRWWDSPDDQ